MQIVAEQLETKSNHKLPIQKNFILNTSDQKSQIQKQWKVQFIALQRLLKEQHSMLWTENQQKVSFEKKLSQTILTYHRNKIQSLAIKQNLPRQKSKQKESKKISTKIKQVFEMGDSKVQKSQTTDQKILLEDEGFGDSCYYIKQILLCLSKDSELMLAIIRKHQTVPNLQSLQSIVKPIVHSMYENIVDDDIYNKDLFVIINQCFKLIVHNAKWYTEIKLHQDKSISAMIVKQFLQKTQIKNYSKLILKNMLLQVTKIDHEVSFNSDEYEKNDPKNQKESSLSLGSSKIRKLDSKTEGSLNDQKINQKSRIQNGNSKITLYAQALQVKDEKMKKSRSQANQMKEKQIRDKNRKCVSRQLLKYLGITEQIQFPTFISLSATRELKKQQQINKQWAAMLNQKSSISSNLNNDIVIIKNVVLIFFSDLFKMLYTLPHCLKIACRLFYEHLFNKYNNKKGCYYVLSEYILGLCIIRQLDNIEDNHEKIFEKTNEKNQKYKLDYFKNNLQTFTKIILGVIRNDFKNIPKSFEYQFNLIVTNLRISLHNYLSQIINIDSQYIKALIIKNPQASQSLNQQGIHKIKSYSVCISLIGIKRLFQMIKFSKAELINVSKNDKLIKKIDRIQMVAQGKDIFNQRQDKKTRLIYKPSNAYVMFYDLELPKQLSINYIKYHDNYFKNDKFKKIMKAFLLSIKSVNCIEDFHRVNSLFDFLRTLSRKSKQYYEINYLLHIENIDNVPVQIKIKYLVSLIKNNYTENQYSSFLSQLISQMHKEAVERTQYYRTVWDKSKENYLKALSSVIYLNQVIINTQSVIAKNIKSKKLDEFIAKTKIGVCLTSPQTRQKDIVSKTYIVKDLLETEKSKIWLQNQARCIHTTLNLEFIKSLTGQPDKIKKQDSHCNNIMKFADVLCSLPEIKSNNAQDIGVKEAFYQFIKYCSDILQKLEQYPFSDDVTWLEQALEQKLSKKIYDKLYPKDPTYEDISFYLRLKTLDFITYSHLKIKPSLRNDKMWELAGRQLRMMDKVKTAGEKLNCINQCSKIILNSYYLLNDSDEPATAQDTCPLVIYVLIKAAPKRMISNMTQIFEQPQLYRIFCQ